MTGDMSHFIAQAEKVTEQYIKANPEYAEILDSVRYIGTSILPELSPPDVYSQAKLGFHPFLEGSFEIELVIFFIQKGLYKSFYHHLRAFFELYVLSVYFLSPDKNQEDAIAWLRGEDKTPYFSAMIELICSEADIVEVERRIGLKKELKDFYKKLCAIIHNRGEQKGNRRIYCGNVPCFSEDMFKLVILDLKQCIENAYTLLALRCPWVLKGFPLTRKFGPNRPVSGFIDEDDAAKIRKFVPENKLEILDEFRDKNAGFISFHDWIMSRPDLSDDEIERQFRECAIEESRFFKRTISPEEVLIYQRIHKRLLSDSYQEFMADAVVKTKEIIRQLGLDESDRSAES